MAIHGLVLGEAKAAGALLVQHYLSCAEPNLHAWRSAEVEVAGFLDLMGVAVSCERSPARTSPNLDRQLSSPIRVSVPSRNSSSETLSPSQLLTIRAERSHNRFSRASWRSSRPSTRSRLNPRIFGMMRCKTPRSSAVFGSRIPDAFARKRSSSMWAPAPTPPAPRGLGTPG